MDAWHARQTDAGAVVVAERQGRVCIEGIERAPREGFRRFSTLSAPSKPSVHSRKTPGNKMPTPAVRMINKLSEQGSTLG